VFGAIGCAYQSTERQELLFCPQAADFPCVLILPTFMVLFAWLFPGCRWR